MQLWNPIAASFKSLGQRERGRSQLGKRLGPRGGGSAQLPQSTTNPHIHKSTFLFCWSRPPWHPPLILPLACPRRPDCRRVQAQATTTSRCILAPGKGGQKISAVAHLSWLCR